MTSVTRPDLSIVIGAYQEAKFITATLEQLATHLRQHDLGRVEVIVVTADSPDGTAKLARAQAHRFESFQLLEPGERVGKGRDIRLGMMTATGRYRLFMDADLATPLHYLDNIQQLMTQNVAVAVAVRDLDQIHHDWLRRFTSGLGNLLARVVLVPGIRDTQCGFKLFKASAAEAIFGRQMILGWGFDMEILALARYLGYPITAFAVPDWRDPKALGDGLTGDSTAGAAWQSFKDLWRVRLRLMLGRYRKASYRP